MGMKSVLSTVASLALVLSVACNPGSEPAESEPTESEPAETERERRTREATENVRNLYDEAMIYYQPDVGNSTAPVPVPVPTSAPTPASQPSATSSPSTMPTPAAPSNQ